MKGTLASTGYRDRHPPPLPKLMNPSWQMEEDMVAAGCDYKLPSSRFSPQWFSDPGSGNYSPNQRLNRSQYVSSFWNTEGNNNDYGGWAGNKATLENFRSSVTSLLGCSQQDTFT